jgi:hypothetical protein
MAEASLLSRKWQDKVVNFQGVRKRDLELVPELFSSFEEVEKEITQEKIGSKVETKDKVKQHAKSRDHGRTKDLTRRRVKDCGRNLLGPSFCC